MSNDSEISVTEAAGDIPDIWLEKLPVRWNTGRMPHLVTFEIPANRTATWASILGGARVIWLELASIEAP